MAFDKFRRQLLTAELRNQLLFWRARYLEPAYTRLAGADVAFMYIDHPVILPFIFNIRRHLGIAVHIVPPRGDFSRYRKVIIPNGLWPQLQEAAASIPAERRLYCEIGFMPQTKNVYFDPKGVHGHSSIRDMPLTPLTGEQRAELQAFRDDFRANDFVRVKWDSINLRTQQDAQQAGEYDFDFVFVPMQLERDTAFELCPFDDNQSIIDRIEAELPDRRIIFKPHPLDTNGPYRAGGDNIVLPTDNKDLRLLLEKCSCVVASNSTVILEALVLGKPCATFGEGFTTNHNITLECHEDLSRLAQIGQWRADPARVDSFLHKLLGRQFSIEFFRDAAERERLRDYLHAQGV